MVDCRSADVEHTTECRSVDRYFNGIYAVGRHEQRYAVKVDVGGGEADKAAVALAVHHLAGNAVAVSEHRGGAFHVALSQPSAYGRRADMAVAAEFGRGYHVDANRLAVALIVGKSLVRPPSEAVVVAHGEQPHVVVGVQQRHKLACRHRRQFMSE